MIFRNIRKIWKPAIYQGNGQMKSYFEGWYYKFADKNAQNIGALIPGVSFSSDGKHSHSFIKSTAEYPSACWRDESSSPSGEGNNLAKVGI